MRYPQRLRSRLLAGLIRNRSGSVLPIVALCGLVIIGVAGFAIDAGRLALMHSMLQSSIDAAGLSSAAKMTTAAVDDEIEKFINANFSSAYVGAKVTSHSSQLSADEKTLQITATAEAPTVFMRLFGINTITTSALTDVTRATGGLELALVLDVTGSMSSSNKIGSLKSAAKDLLQIVFGGENSVEHLHVGIVPFTQTVNVGSSRTGWLTGGVPSNWSGCVEMRSNGLDTSDKSISAARFVALKSGACPPGITPLTSSKQKLISAIDKLTPDGGTNVNVGAVWGWRLLSPQWRGLWGGDMGLKLPLDYDADGMSKAAVIMTDGKNEISSGSAYGEISCKRSWFFLCLEYGYDNRLGVSANSENNARNLANEELDQRLTKVCTAMKNAGIVVYTVALGSPGAEIEERMRACATQNAFFFNSPTGAELRTAFAKIGDSLSNLRISR